MDDPNTLKLTPHPDSHHPHRVLLYGLAALLIIVVALSAGYLLGVKNTQPAPQQSVTPIVSKPTPTIDQTANWQTYSSSQYGFQFKYSTDFTNAINSPEYIPPYNLQNQIITVRKQGFQDTTAQYSQYADFSVSSSTDIANCYSYNNISLSNTPLTDKQTINGMVYYVGKKSGVASGHSANGTFYRIIANNSCIEISTVIEIQTGGGQGLTSLQSQITSDQQQLQSELAQILSTFKFTNQNQTSSNGWQQYTSLTISFSYPSNFGIVPTHSQTQNKDITYDGLIVAPKATADMLNKLIQQGTGIGGGKYEAIDISTLPLMPEGFISDSTKTVTNTSVTVAGQTAVQYTTIYKTAIYGANPGDTFIETVFTHNNTSYTVELLDQQYRSVYDHLLSTFQFTN